MKKLGDTLPNTAKDFSVTHRCGVSTVTKTTSIPAEASGKSVTLRCVALDLLDLVGTWENRFDKEAFAANPALTAKMTSVDANTLRWTQGDGVAFNLKRSADPTVLDLGPDYPWYSELNWKLAHLITGDTGRVEGIYMGEFTGGGAYHRAL